MVNDSGKSASPLMPAETTEFLEIQTMRIDRRRFTKSLYKQLPIEELFEIPGEWLGRPFVQVMACSSDCPGSRPHLHVVWQKGRTARLSIVNEERDRYLDEQAIEAAENGLAENVKLYVMAGLLANHQVVTFDRDTYLVRGVWSQDYVFRGFRTVDLPFEVDEWLGCEPVDSSPTADLLYSQRYYSCRLVAAELSKSSAVLPHKLKKRLMLEMHEWRNPKGCLFIHI
jgi:hypothetical protein